MEGGQKTPINLEAGLDISTSDMLVPFAAQTFQHNWQKYQGKFLPNSLRFEKNGWAAGWNVYNFEYSTFRKQLTDDVYAGVGQFNSYTKLISVYDSETSYNSLADYYVVQNNTILSGDATISDDTITGTVNDKDYTLVWDPGTHTVSSATTGISVEQVTNSDYSQTLTISDDSSTFNFDFSLLTATSLSGDALSDITYSGFDGTVHTWGGYSFDISTAIVTTPEGDSIIGTISDDNLLSFGYTHNITNETLNIVYNTEKFYSKFLGLTGKDTNDETKMLLASDAAESLKFNHFAIELDKDKLLSADEDGVIVNLKLPVWFSCCATPSNVTPEAYYCDNCALDEVMVHVGTGINVSYSYKNAYDNSSGTGTCVDDYRVYTSKAYYQTISGLKYRFNQIFINNTIEPSSSWSPYKVTLSTDNFWVSSSQQYYNIRKKNTAKFKSLLGNVYTYGTFTYKLSDYFDYNNPYDWSVATNGVYVRSDISTTRSIKLLTETSSFDLTGDDTTFVKNKIPTDATLSAKYVANLTGTTTDYSSSQAAKTYAQLYTSGVYTGGTYEAVSTVFSDTEFWPFSKVPKFNLTIGTNTINGVYWTDGTSYITDLDEFKEKVLGERDDDYTPTDPADYVIENTSYSRTRVVKNYKCFFDFDYVYKSSYTETTDYTAAVQAWNTVWKKYYPNNSSPLDMFSEDAVSSDNTYYSYNDIEKNTGVTPTVSCITPGQCANQTTKKSYAIPFNNNAGVIWYKTGTATTVDPHVYHGTKDVTSDYTVSAEGVDGRLYDSSDKTICTLPLYYGSTASMVLYYSNAQDQITSGSTKVNGIPSTLSETVGIDSAQLVLGVNYELKTIETSYPDTYPNVIYKRFINDDIYEVKYFEKVSSRDSNWLECVWISFNSGEAIVHDATLHDDVHKVTTYQCVGDINAGIKFGWPVWANSATRLVYPKMLSQTDINSSDAFTFTKVDTADIDDSEIYFDRDDTAKSVYLYDVDATSAVPDDGTGSGYYGITLTSVGDTGIYYAKKQYDSNKTEIFSDYYLPGILYGDASSTDGNMSLLSSDFGAQIAWVPVTVSMPTSAVCTFSNTNSTGTSHRLYNSDSSYLSGTVAIDTDAYDADTGLVPIVLTVNNTEFNLNYDTVNKLTVPVDTDKTIIDNEYEKVVITTCAGTGSTSTALLDINLIFNDNSARFYAIPTTGYTLDSVADDIVTVSDATNTIKYNVQSQKVISPSSNDTTVYSITNGQHISSSYIASVIITAMLRAVYDGTINGTKVTFTYKGVQYTVDLAEAAETDTGISVVSTDIRTADKTKTIGKLDTDGQYQFLKQQWNTTVEVENYWWVDSKHTLELTQYSFILRRNTEELDDWNGNRFEKIFEINRSNILPTNVLKYFMTSVYNPDKYTAMFVTMQMSEGSILVKLYEPRENMGLYSSFTIAIKSKELGTVLNDTTFDATNNIAYFNSYNPIKGDQVLPKATWSSTIVGNKLILGCHMSNNYDQWAILYDLDTKKITKVIQGYGFVGLHGDLTGGMLPADYFDIDKGFNDKVQPLSVLGKVSAEDVNNLDAAYEVGDVNKLNNIDAKVVGTNEQQWYIKQKLYGIVSHLTYSNGTFTKQLIPITNNYTSVYKSPSFGTQILGDTLLQCTSFATMFKLPSSLESIWTTFMTFCGMPSLYYLAPRFSNFLYLQQTFGQYAYVHYNSSLSMPQQEISNSETNSGISEKKNKQTDPVLSSDYTFDKQKFSQTMSAQVDFYNTGLLAVIVSSFSASIQILDAKMSLNEEQAQSAISDIGRKYVENVEANVGDMIASNIMTQSRLNSGISSHVTGLKSLDMFYSTADKQNVYAGPGFTEHQYVANCVAQSSTDVQVEGKVTMLFFCIRALTAFQLTITIKLENLLADETDKIADATAAQMVCGTSLSSLAVGIHAVAYGIRTMIAAQEVCMEQLEKILDAICANGIQCSVDGAVTKHALSVEGKHKYGEKNETFMWPCWGVTSGELKYTDESVACGIRNTPWKLSLNSRCYWTNILWNSVSPILDFDVPKYSSNKANVSDMLTKTGLDNSASYNEDDEDDDTKAGDCFRAYYHKGSVPYYQAAVYGETTQRTLPNNMAKVEGVSNFLPSDPFKNENIAVSAPAFTPSMQQDYIVDSDWDLSQYCTYGMIQWIAVKDTKVIDCAPSNMYVSSSFCGIACPYTAIEVKSGIQKAYMRPYAVTPNTLALNCTGYNAILDNCLYHAFDGISFRIVDFVGSPGMSKNAHSYLYTFQVNDRFKRSNIVPANELLGNFMSEPVQAVNTIDHVWTELTVASKEKGMEAGTVGEDKDLIRWAIPVFTEHVSTLPASVKTVTAMTLGVVDGITSLCVDLANNQVAYKAPLSVDFTIGKQVYRATEEYICSVNTQNGIDQVTNLIPSLGLKFIGATPTQAFFYSKSNRCYYVFTGSAITKFDMMERFRDIQKGYWDFVNQEVVMPCLMTYKRLNPEVEDKDTETDNIIIPVLSNGHVSGELPPPITTIFNDRSWYKCVSLPSGFAYQGPNRVIINRSVFVEYMLETMKMNFNKWTKMDKEKYVTHRVYPEEYDNILTNVSDGIDGWTYNPFVLVTSPLGNSEETDCLFEWTITFCWPIEMDLLYGSDNYAVVNVMAETMTPGGRVKARPTHIYLTKELFTRNGNYGYYSIRYQSKNGAGNRERLHVWSDQYIAISSLSCESKVVTSRRTEQLTQQVDIQRLKEL